jgi:hypothetical protein
MKAKGYLFRAVSWWAIVQFIMCGIGYAVLRFYPEGKECGNVVISGITTHFCYSTGTPNWLFIVVLIVIIALPLVIAQRIYVKGGVK